MTPPLGLRRLPVTVEPVPGESLRSLIEQTARTHQVPVQAILNTAGFRISGNAGHTLGLLDGDAGAHAPSLAAVLGLSIEQVEATTLRGSNDSTTIAQDDGKPVHLGWGTAAPGRHCTRCLAENGGRWLLTWLSPWTLLCPRHQVLLAVRCHACRRAPRGGTTAPNGVLPLGYRCSEPTFDAAGRRDGTLCRADLTAVATSRAGTYAMIGQAFVDDLRSLPPHVAPATPAGDSARVQDHLQDLRLLARHMHTVVMNGDYEMSGREARTWRTWTAHRDRTSTLLPNVGTSRNLSVRNRSDPETDAYATAVGLAAVIIGAPDVTAAYDLLRPAVRSAQSGAREQRWRYQIKKAWASEDAAQWLLDALDYNAEV